MHPCRSKAALDGNAVCRFPDRVSMKTAEGPGDTGEICQLGKEQDNPEQLSERAEDVFYISENTESSLNQDSSGDS